MDNQKEKDHRFVCECGKQFTNRSDLQEHSRECSMAQQAQKQSDQKTRSAG